jgi:class 3 adenylate cyclase
MFLNRNSVNFVMLRAPEFISIVDAVESAIEIQKSIRNRNVHLLENRRMTFRIGINLGDVIEQGERIYGDGVNITTRLEGLVEAGHLPLRHLRPQRIGYCPEVCWQA